jgi:hypothetical protein
VAYIEDFRETITVWHIHFFGTEAQRELMQRYDSREAAILEAFQMKDRGTRILRITGPGTRLLEDEINRLYKAKRMTTPG